MLRLPLLIFIFIKLSLGFASAQQALKSAVRFLDIKQAEEQIVVDGELDDAAWKHAVIAKDFIQHFPFDSSLALSQTEVMMTYDSKNIYLAAKCYRSLEGEFIISSLKRDFNSALNDNFTLIIDPFDDKLNGFSFSVSPFNVQQEGLVANGGNWGINSDWDNKWFSATKVTEFGWQLEMAIPFKTLRFNPKINKWGINFLRTDLIRNEVSTWSFVPRNFNATTMAFTGILNWDTPPKKSGINMVLMPYTSIEANKNYLTNSGLNNRFNVGTDVKIGVTSSLNLDLTFNPDFSQADVDRQITNLTRFSLFFPERRQFFLENSDLFANFGFSGIRPFFSRQIGLFRGERVPILFGARLSGKINRNWRIGAMNMQTGNESSLGYQAQNYAVGAFQRQLSGRSYFSGIFVNRQGLMENNRINAADYNRVIGFDYKLASLDNKWTGIFFIHKSFSPNLKGDDFAHASYLNFSIPNLDIMWNHEYVGRNYRADVGFVPRQDNFNALENEIIKLAFWRLEPRIAWSIFPGGKINKITHAVYSSWYADSTFKTSDAQYSFTHTTIFQNTSRFSASANEYFVRTFFPIDITYTGAVPLPSGVYKYRNINISYATDLRKRLKATAGIERGSFFNGRKQSYNFALSYRAQPYGVISINYTRDEVKLPNPYAQTNLNLIGPQFDLAISRSLFFNTIIQYNTQADNINVFSRLQWRFKPMSDLFIVYSENYDAMDLTKKNRAIVCKLVYWFSGV